jgi:hypothetical protein
MGRTRALAAAVALAFALTPAGAVLATTASFVWTGAASAEAVSGLGTSAVYVSATSPATLTLDMVLNIGADGLSAVGADIEFDADFGDELDVASYFELGWGGATASLAQLTPGIASSQESSPTAEGQLFGFEAVSLGQGPANTTLTFARVVFTTNPANIATDGDDVATTDQRDPYASVFFDNAEEGQGSVLRLFASVNLIPEPATGALLGLGLAALAAARRRRAH